MWAHRVIFVVLVIGVPVAGRYYDCHNYTPEDFATGLPEPQMCQRVKGRVFTRGHNGPYPGCGGCYCCKPGCRDTHIPHCKPHKFDCGPLNLNDNRCTACRDPYYSGGFGGGCSGWWGGGGGHSKPDNCWCQLNAWRSWGSCSQTCGGGTQHRTRTMCCQPGISGYQCHKNCKIYNNDLNDHRGCGQICYHGGSVESTRCDCSGLRIYRNCWMC